DAVRAVMGPSGSMFQRIHSLWILERLAALDDEVLAGAADDDEREVRVHAMRVLAERKELTEEQRHLALTRLDDKGKDPFVLRCAADARGHRAEPDSVAPHLALGQSGPAADTHLLHVVRMAIRDVLRVPESWKQVAKLGDGDQKTIADVAGG